MSEWNHSVCEHCWHAKHGDRPACRIIEPEVDICCYCRRLHTFGAYIRAAPTTVLCDGQHLLETLRTENAALKAENERLRASGVSELERKALAAAKAERIAERSLFDVTATYEKIAPRVEGRDLRDADFSVGQAAMYMNVQSANEHFEDMAVARINAVDALIEAEAADALQQRAAQEARERASAPQGVK